MGSELGIVDALSRLENDVANALYKRRREPGDLAVALIGFGTTAGTTPTLRGAPREERDHRPRPRTSSRSTQSKRHSGPRAWCGSYAETRRLNGHHRSHSPVVRVRI
jgi:hypothetical protein